MHRYILTCLCCLLAGSLSAQSELLSRVDSSCAMVYTGINVGYQWTMADLSAESTNLMDVGLDLAVKNKKNWCLEVGFNYYFSGKVKGTDSLFRFITNQDGSIIDGNGSPADIDVDQRMWALRLVAGKTFPISENYRNSGIQLKLGATMLQRYVYIKNPENKVAALTDEYKKGYDRLTSGFGLYQYLGYIHLQKRLNSFYAGIEATEVFSHRQRDWDFSLMRKDDRRFMDIMVGIRLGWIIPLYRQETQDTFYFR